MPVAEEDRPIAIGRGRPSKYPWEEWMNGEYHIIERGKDFRISVQSMRSQLHVKCLGEEGLRVETGIEGNKIAFQFFRDSDASSQGA